MSDTQPTAAQPGPPEEQLTQPTPGAAAPPPPPLPPPPPPPAGPPPEWRQAPPVAGQPRFRDRVFGLWSLAAGGVAGVVLGGLSGFAIHAATDSDHQDGRMGQFGPRFGGPGGGFQRGPGGGFPNGGPGQLPGGPGQGPGHLPSPGTTQQPSPTPAPSS